MVACKVGMRVGTVALIAALTTAVISASWCSENAGWGVSPWLELPDSPDMLLLPEVGGNIGRLENEDCFWGDCSLFSVRPIACLKVRTAERKDGLSVPHSLG